MKTFGLINNGSACLRSSFSDKIKRKELEKYIKIKKWKTGGSELKTRQGMRPARIEFKIEGEQGRKGETGLGVVVQQGGGSGGKENSSFLTVVAKPRPKPLTAVLREQK